MEHYFRLIANYKPLTKKEELSLFLKAKGGDDRAKDKLLNANLKFVVSTAKKYQNQGLTLQELVADGNYGLMKAYHKFDVGRDVKFITYAVWWIRQSIINSIHEHAKLIRLPLNKITNVTKLAKTKERLEQRLGRAPDNDELLDELGDNYATILRDSMFNYQVIALDEPHADNGTTLDNVIPAEPTSQEMAIEASILKQELESVLIDFTQREKDILYMYYGIEQVRPYTLKEIGVDMGLTRERIRQIKEKALTKLRRKHRADRLRGYVS
jgi:RNA polymerase primary sigma factor